MLSARGFKTYPLQSVLIILAVALGVAVVTAVAATFNQSLSQLDGDELWQRQITLQTRENDQAAFYNGGDAVPVREVGLLNEEKATLTLDDLTRARAAAPTADYAYVSSWYGFTVDANGDSFDLDVSAVMADYLAAADIEVIRGGLFSESDFAENRRVMLLPEGMLERLGLEGDPVGQRLTVSDFGGESDYTIVGVLEDSDTGPYGSDTFIPYRPAPWEDGLRELTFAVDNRADVAQARAELQAYAQRTWGGRVTVNSADDWNAEGEFRVIALVIAAFASTALAAAALNIMNLMLARVLRQRHSIGILRSLGASRGDILWGFLGESLLLGALGGLLGVGAGYGLYVVYNRYQVAFYGDDFAGFLTAFPWPALLIGFAIALATSLIFGFYPALQASRLRPVEALREV